MLEHSNWFGDKMQLTHFLETPQRGNEVILMRGGILEYCSQLGHVFEHEHLIESSRRKDYRLSLMMYNRTQTTGNKTNTILKKISVHRDAKESPSASEK